MSILNLNFDFIYRESFNFSGPWLSHLQNQNEKLSLPILLWESHEIP